MSASWTTADEAPLYAEHLLLGGTFAEDESHLATPLHYGDPHEIAAFGEGCALCDLSGMAGILVSGPGASTFVSAACAQRNLAIGECAFGAIVTGDGSVTAIPLVARTGDEEYLVWDPSARGLALLPWLSFLGNIEQQGYRPFEGVCIEDVSDSLVPLLLWGPEAKTVLSDYVASSEQLPKAGTIANVRLDRIECLVAQLPRNGAPCYLVLAPPAASRALWRSFLSFTVVTPVGSQQLSRHASVALPWAEATLATERLELALEQLLAWELVRSEGGYVGARALQA